MASIPIPTDEITPKNPKSIEENHTIAAVKNTESTVSDMANITKFCHFIL